MNGKNKKIISLLLLAVMVVTLVSTMSSCLLIGTGESYLTEEEVRQMMDNTLSGNVTVEGGDSYNVTINGVEQNNAAIGKSVLSAVSIRATFKVAAYSTFYPQVSTSTKEKTGAGSGIIYKLDKNRGNAYIITNYHVVHNSQAVTENGRSSSITAYLYGQESDAYAIPATYVGGSMEYDLAVLKVSGSRVLAESNAVAVSLADSDAVSVLDQAIAIGNPEGLGISATLGYINVDSEYIDLEGADGYTTIRIRVMRMDTAVNGGNSGGGLFNNRGELIGIVNAKLIDSENMGYAIPSNFVKYVVENILFYCDNTELENVYRCYLGITVVPAEMYTVYDTETGKVLRRETVGVSEINSGSLADGLLKVGDIINSITIDGTTYNVNRMYMVVDSMINARVGSTVTLNVTRGGDTFDVTVEIGQSAMQKIN